MAARSLSQTAYRALSRGQGQSTYRPSAERLVGDYIWLHAGHPERLPALLSLSDQIQDRLPDMHVVISHTGRKKDVTDLDVRGCVIESSISDHPDAARAFLDYWSPKAGLWDWGALKPNLVDYAGSLDLPMQLTSAASAGFDGRRDRWVPELTRHLLRQFRSAVAVDDAAEKRLVRLGMPKSRITISAGLSPEGRLPPFVSTDLEDLSKKLAGRPVWLGAHLSRDEIAAVIAAHRVALRRSHRLLLVLNPASETDRDMALDHLEQAALRVAIWGEGQMPEETHQVLLADLPDEHGLWYRLAPVSFLGQSMTAEESGVSPFEAAAVGTAILYGPHVKGFVRDYSALSAASAAQVVSDPIALSKTLERVIAPDVAAGMALAGWDVASQGAEANNRALEVFELMLERAA